MENALVSSSHNEAVPHINIRSPRLQPGKFVVGETKRLLQQNRHFSDLTDSSNVRFAPIVLKNSKIAGLRKSRKWSALAISAAAGAVASIRGPVDRFCGNSCGPSPRSERDAPTILRIFRSSAKRDFFNTIRQRRPFAELRTRTLLSGGPIQEVRCALYSSAAMPTFADGGHLGN